VGAATQTFALGGKQHRAATDVLSTSLDACCLELITFGVQSDMADFA